MIPGSRLPDIIQLRTHGENDAANAIAKNTIEMVQTFNQVTAPWDFQMFMMAPSPSRPRPGLATTGTGAQLRPAVATAGSWASVAAMAVEKKNNEIIKFSPSDGLVKKYEPQAHAHDLRVVWIQGWGRGRPLGEISQFVNQGPIWSMAYASDHEAVCIIFQHASSAQALVDSCTTYEAESGESLFGAGCRVILGQAYPVNDDLRRMNAPWHERRRLTFARSQLFSHGMTDHVFRQDIFDMVGEENVELVWLFNTGNGGLLPSSPGFILNIAATVVFSSSSIASLVRDNFFERSRVKGDPYHNIHVSFSHDPCEKPMNLITQIDSPTTARFRSNSHRSEPTSNNGNGLYRSNSRAPGRLARRESKRNAPKQDDDGWQTVTHKK